MISLGIWSCRWRELQPISFGSSGRATDLVSESQNNQAVDEGVGHNHGRGRGRGTDNGGEYEMAPVKNGRQA